MSLEMQRQRTNTCNDTMIWWRFQSTSIFFLFLFCCLYKTENGNWGYLIMSRLATSALRLNPNLSQSRRQCVVSIFTSFGSLVHCHFTQSTTRPVDRTSNDCWSYVQSSLYLTACRFSFQIHNVWQLPFNWNALIVLINLCAYYWDGGVENNMIMDNRRII